MPPIHFLTMNIIG